MVLVGPATVLAGAQSATAAPAGRYLDPVFSSVRVDADLVYGRVMRPAGVERLKLDLYRPAGDAARNRPAVIFIHGGDSSVDKGAARNRVVPRGLALRGFVAASINYRTGTNGATPAAQHDTRAAVRWFKANATRYGVDPRQVVVMGSSAGAVNALNVAFHPEDPGNSGHPGYSSRVAAAISVAGASTQPHTIGRGEAPIAMMHAADDMTAPLEAARATCTQTTTFGNVCEFFEYAEGGHPPGFLSEYHRRILEQASRFMCRHVLGGTACRDRDSDGVVDR